ncbi:putative photosynthetic complex assembly protein PuhC [Sphingomonas sp. SUN019]|uniref:photosynthetic complex assembly protein PuhC n=1 Tax=Sphingomonas sp. SUN019 TaxID=2937788 RepID=UPI0021649C41|nr:photosynthetic complex assembly protein PuhC [Sphingomonas sp. SUN019]UVO50829.1 putative photosynthetic complex assembly protein PuhC [Sphingomonas sp. SUN019]
MSKHDHDNMLPRGALYFAGGLVIFALAATATARIANITPAASPAVLRAETKDAPIASRHLRFVDRGEGAVVITDTQTGQIAHIVKAGEETGFIRGVMRGLARERRMHGIGNTPPFVLTQWRDGQLSLDDSATGRSIELGAFGNTNRAAFAALLEHTT